MDRMLAATVEIDVPAGPDAEGARRAPEVAGPASTSRVPPPDPEVPAKVQRRRFSAEYRLRILKQADVHYGRADQVLQVRHRARLAAYAAHPERFVNGPPRPETLPTAVWINPPTHTAVQDAPGTTIVTPDDPQHRVICPPQPISDDRLVALVTSVESLQ